MSDRVPLEVQNSLTGGGEPKRFSGQFVENLQAQYFQQPHQQNQGFQGNFQLNFLNQSSGPDRSLRQNNSTNQYPQGQSGGEGSHASQQDQQTQQISYKDQSHNQSSQRASNYYPPKELGSTYPAPNNTQVTDKLVLMEHDSERLRALSNLLDKIVNPALTEEEANAKAQIDARSVYIGNVDYGATPLELQQHFSGTGVVERVTIMTNKVTGQPKGFAYLEFSLPEGARQAVTTLDGSVFRDRELKVNLKRTNVPGISTTNRGMPRGRARGRGMFRGRGRAGFRGRGFRGQSRFLPY